jgi:hypothetical protein
VMLGDTHIQWPVVSELLHETLMHCPRSVCLHALVACCCYWGRTWQQAAHEAVVLW